jgi:hypothetical protein
VTDDAGGPNTAALARGTVGAESMRRVVYCPGVPPVVPNLIEVMPANCATQPTNQWHTHQCRRQEVRREENQWLGAVLVQLEGRGGWES